MPVLLDVLRRQGAKTLACLLPCGLWWLVALGSIQVPFVAQLDRQLYDTKLRWLAPQVHDDRVVIIDIDEPSLAKEGHWPWGRDRLALLARRLLDEQGVAVLGFDVLFAQSDTTSGLPVLQDLAQGALKGNPAFREQLRLLEPQLNRDGLLAEALRGRPVALGYYFTSDREGYQQGVLPPALWPDGQLGMDAQPIYTWDGFGANIAMLAAAAPVAGFFNAVTDPDGVVRTLPLVARHSDRYYESLSLAVFRLFRKAENVWPMVSNEVGGPKGMLTALSVQGSAEAIRIPVDGSASIRVPFRGAGGPHGSGFRYISAQDVLAGRLTPGSLRGQIALVGSTAPGLMDLRATPVSQAFPGVEVHANAISALLSGRNLVRPDYAAGYEFSGVLAIGVLMWIAALRLTVLGQLAVTAVLGLALLGVDAWLFSVYGLVLPVAAPGLVLVAIAALTMALGYFTESRHKIQLASLFQTYVPPELVRQMLQAPSRYSMRAVNQEVTVMFCDIRGFTSLSENMNPLDVQALLQELFSGLTRCIRTHHGTVDKYMGDCVMAFWGAPVAQPDHATLAVMAALDMERYMFGFNRSRQSQGLSPLTVGIGLHTGAACVGDMGSEFRRSYTVVGDVVNVASRLEGQTRSLGVTIVASEATRQAAGDGVVWTGLGEVEVKGKLQRLQIATPASGLTKMSHHGDTNVGNQADRG